MVSTLTAALDARDRNLTRYAMHASLACKDRKGNQFVTSFANYNRDDSHVEVVLLRRLVEFYKGGITDIPNLCTILVYCSFSPCKECTATSIKNFVDTLKPAERDIRVRFIFENYYTLTNWKNATSEDVKTDQAKMWPDGPTAQAAYFELGARAGILSVKTSGFYDEPSDKTVVTEKMPWALEIRPVGMASLSVVSQFVM